MAAKSYDSIRKQFLGSTPKDTSTKKVEPTNQYEPGSYDDIRSRFISGNTGFAKTDARIKQDKQISADVTPYAQRVAEFISSDGYEKYSIGWLSDSADSKTPEKVKARNDYYTNNVQKIADLDARIRTSSGSEKKELEKQKESLEAENREYERTQKVVDDYFNITQQGDFESDSKKRDYKNPTREDMEKYESRISNGITYDANGVGRDVFGDVFDDTYDERFKEPEVVDRLGLFLGTDAKTRNEAYATTGTGIENAWESVIKDGIDSNWDKLNEQEISIYYYLLDNDGQEKADKYLSDMKVELNRRATKERTQAIDDADALERIAMNIASIPANVVAGAVALTDDLYNMATGNEINPYSTAHSLSNFSQDVRSATAQDINDLTGNVSLPFIGTSFGDVYQALMSGADSLFGGKVIGKGYTILMGTNAATSEARKLYEQGASDSQIAMGAFTSGVAEALFEYVSLDKFLNPNESAGVIRRFLEQAGVEATEEMCTEVANTISNALIMKSQSEWQKLYDEGGFKEAFLGTLSEVLNAGIGGFISGGAMSLGGSAIGRVADNMENTDYGKRLSNIAMDKAYIDYAKNNDLGKKGNKILSEIENMSDSDKMSNKDYRNIGRLATMINQNQSESAIKAEISDRLLKDNLPNDAKIVDSVYKYLTNNADIKIASNDVRAIANQMKSSENFASSVAMRTMNSRLNMVQDHATRVSEQKTTQKMQEAYGDKVSDSGNTVDSSTGESISVKNIASIENGTMMLNTEGGKTVDSNNVEYASLEDAMAYESIKALGCSADVGNNILSELKNSNLSANAFMNNVVLAFNYGMTNQVNRVADLLIPIELGKQLFKEGKAHANSIASKMTLEAKNRNASAKTSNVVTLLNDVGRKYERNELNDKQKSTIKVANMLSKTTNLEISVFESYKRGDKNYINVNGVEQESSANGWFVTGTNKIFIDINAGNDFSGLGLFTLAHESGHYIRDWNAEGWQTLADLIVEEIDAQAEADSSKPTFEQLVANKYNTYSNNRAKEEKLIKEGILKKGDYAGKTNEELSDMAYEDVICDSLASLMAEKETFVQFSNKLKEKDQGLWNKLKSFIKNFLKKIEKVLSSFNGVQAEGYAGQAVQNAAKEMHDKIRDLYVSAFLGADENYNAAVKNSSNESTVEISDTESVEASKVEEMTKGAESTTGENLFQHRAMEHDMPEYKELLLKYGMESKEVDRLFGIVDKVMEKVKANLEILDYDWELDIDDRSFNPVKPNSDSLYKYSVDFSTLCRKRILQQMVQVQLQEALDRAVTREESIAIRNELMKIQEEGREIEVACALCYVESARMKSPVQIQKFLDNRRQIITEFFANKDGGDTKAKIEKAEVDARNRLAKEYAKEIESGEYNDPSAYTVTKKGKKKYTSLKQLPGFMKDEIRNAKKSVTKNYVPTSEESRLLDIADSLSTSDFTSPEGLAKLIKQYPRLFDAYTSFVRNATKSKGLEKDTWWRVGDSLKVGDDLIAAMNKENGLRSQSWSDFQVIHTLDYIAAIIELSTRNAKMQAYTKVADYVKLMGNTNQMINLSLIPNAVFKGILEYDSVEGMDFKKALELRDKYPATVGTICIGIDNKQIQMLLASELIDYVIPYHQSGMSQVLRKAMHIPTWVSYESFQNESELNGLEAEELASSYGVKLLSETDENWHKKPDFSEWFNLGKAKKIASRYNSLSENDLTDHEKQMKKQYGVMFGGYVAMQQMADNYLRICAERGLNPKFCNEKANFTVEDNYWKLLIDRKMIDNKTGEIIEQKAVKPIFNESDVLQILEDEVKRYPKVKEDQDYATKTVVEKFLSGEIINELNAVEKITGAVKTSVDNITKVSILNSANEVKNSERAEFTDTTTNEDVKYSIREEAPPKKTLKGYKVFVVKDGKLYPPMVANPNASDTPIGVWLNADIGVQAPDSKTGRKQVKAGGKGTQGGSGSLAFRPGWHLGETPLATQFDRLNPETGVKDLFPENFVWAECDIAADVDYQEEAMSYGYNKNGKFQHSLAGLPKLPTDGYYRYRTNPNPNTVPWLITGAMKVNRLLSDAEVNEILAEKGIAPKQRQGGNKTLADLGLAQYEGIKYSVREEFSDEIDQWQREGRPEDEQFILGSTGDVLQGLGAIESDIYMLGDKINTILEEHPEMTLDEIKKIPKILENPTLVLESKNLGRPSKDNTRLVMFGTVKAKDGLPVLVALDMRPIEKNLVIEGMQKVTSAYTKDSNPVEFLKGSKILYLDKKKTTSLLRSIGFQSPIELNYSGYIGNISYYKRNVKFDGKPFTDVVSEPNTKHSDRDSYAPTFYSKMSKVIDGIKTEKIGANGVIPYLKGKGVKDEEIKWSGIATFLEGKKSVTKSDLEEFANGSMLQIEEKTISSNGEALMKLSDLVQSYGCYSSYEDWINPMSDTFDIDMYKRDIESYLDDEVISQKHYDELIEAGDRYIADGDTRWGNQTTEGGTNYREILFKMPNSDYSNTAMKQHWEQSGVLAHARIQDFDTEEGKMLFVEEIQSDWHNASSKNPTKSNSHVIKTVAASGKSLYYILDNKRNNEIGRVTSREIEANGIADNSDSIHEYFIEKNSVPDAPFKTTYTDFVMKRLLRIACEEGYDLIGWTTGQMQEERWSSDYSEGYRIEYDQDIPKFMNKYGKQWGAKVSTDILDETGDVVHSFTITPSMKQDVLHEGQALYSDRVLMGSMFSGGGTLEAGLVYQMVDKEFAVEYNKKIAAVYTDNHGKEHMFVGDVRDFNSKGKKNVFYLHASPVCKNFSSAKVNGGETTLDIVTAKATARVIEEQMPQVFTLENVKRYKGSEAYNLIVNKLTELGYKWDVDVYNSADYRAATSRERLIIRAVKNGELPSKPAKIGFTPWYYVVSDLIDELPEAPMPKWMKERYDAGNYETDRPLFILGGNKGYKLSVAYADEPAPTLLANSHDARIVMPDGRVLRATPRVLARIQGLPDSYNLPKQTTLAYTVVGNGIPTQLTKAVMGGVLDSAYEQTHEGEKLYSDRDTSLDTRTILSNALASTAQNEIEKKYISQYQQKIATINKEQAKLNEFRAKIKELSFAKGHRDADQIRRLQDEATKTANRINTFDKQLLKLEATKPLKQVIDREKAIAKKKAEKEGREALSRYRERAAQTQRDLMNRYKERTDNRKSTELRNKVKKYIEDFRQRLQNPTERRYIPARLVNQIIDVYNFIDPTGADQETKAAQKYRNTKEALAELKLQYDNLKTMDYEFSSEFNEEFSQNISDLAEAVGDKPLREMSRKQLEDVYTILHDISAMIKDATKQIGISESISNYEAGQELITNMRSVKGLGLTTNALSSFFREWTENPLRAVREMSGFNLDSRLVKLFDALNDGRIKADKFTMDSNKKFDSLRNTKDGEKAFNDAVEKASIKVTDTDGNEVMISKMQAMQAILTYRREKANENRSHLSSPVRFTDVALDVKGKYSDAFDKGHDVMVDENFVNYVTAELSAWDKVYLALASEFFNVDSKNAVNEVSMITKHRPVALENDYIPYYVNQDYIAKESDNVKFDASIEGMGMLKSVKNNAPQQLVMRGLNSVIDDHIGKVAKVYGLSIPIRNWNKVFNMIQTKDDGGVSVKNAIRDTWKDGGVKLLDQAVADLQSNRKAESVKALSGVKSAFVTSTLASNLSVWMKQAASYPTAGAILSGSSLTKALPSFGKNLNSVWDEIDEHTPQHWIRRQGMSTQELGEMNQTHGWQNKLNKKLGAWSPMNWIQAMDVKTTAVLWLACKYEVESRGVSKGSEDYWDQVTKLYNKVIEDTQPMYDPLHRAEVTKNSALKNIIMFQTQPIQNSGILREGAMEYKMAKKHYGKKSPMVKEAGTKYRKAVTSQIASHFVFTSMTLLASALLHKMNPWRDDDKELTPESISLEFGKEFLENYFGAVVPILGNLGVSLAEKVVGGSSYDVLSDPTVDKINTTIDAFAKLKNPSFDNFTNMVCDIASYLGIPAKNVYNIISGAILHAEDAINGEFLSFESGIDRSMKQDVGRMYSSYSEGDTEKMKSIVNDLIDEKVESGKEEKEARSSVRSSITSYCKPLFLDAYSSNDNGTMANIRKFMSATGCYDDVVKTTQDWIKKSKK